MDEIADKPKVEPVYLNRFPGFSEFRNEGCLKFMRFDEEQGQVTYSIVPKSVPQGRIAKSWVFNDLTVWYGGQTVHCDLTNNCETKVSVIRLYDGFFNASKAVEIGGLGRIRNYRLEEEGIDFESFVWGDAKTDEEKRQRVDSILAGYRRQEEDAQESALRGRLNSFNQGRDSENWRPRGMHGGPC